MSGTKAAGLAVLLVGSIVGLALFSMRPSVTPPAPPQIPIPKQSGLPNPPAKAIPCRVVPRNTVWASTPATGQVEAVYVEVGQVVFDGQVLARIKTGGPAPGLAASAEAAARDDASEIGRKLALAQADVKRLQQQATEARAALARMEPAYQKQKLLHDAGATPRLAFEKARADRDGAAEQLSLAEEASRQAENLAARLADEQRRLQEVVQEKSRASVAAVSGIASAEIHAPAAGVVMQRRISPKDQVSDRNRAELFQIAIQPQLLRAEFEGSPGWKPGEAVALSIDGAKIGSVIGEGGTADFESRTGTVLPDTPCSASLQIK